MATNTRSAKRKAPVRTAKRRSFTAAQKKQILAAWKAAKKSGISFRAFCRKRRVPESTVRSWINGSVGSQAAVNATAARRRASSGTKARRVTRAKAKSARGKAKPTTKAKSARTTKSRAKAPARARNARTAASRSTKAKARRK